MLAFMSRSFKMPLDPSSVASETPPYVLNDLPNITDPSTGIALLKEWQEALEPEDSFDFDYHLWSAYLYESSGYELAEVLSQDIKNFKALDLNGLVSCQAQSVFLPTALVMNVMADTLWDRTASFDAIVERTLKLQFGQDDEIVLDYLKALLLTDVEKVIRQIFSEGWEENLPNLRVPEERVKMQKTIDVISQFRKQFEFKMEKAETENIRHNWAALFFHGKLLEAINRFYLADGDDIQKARDELFALADAHANEFQLEFDRMTHMPSRV